MGASQSSASQTPSRGLHVLRVTPSSPASQTDIEPFFDFLVGFKGDSPTENTNLEATELEKIVESHEGKTLNLVVWNSKNQNRRSRPCSYLWKSSNTCSRHIELQLYLLYHHENGPFHTLFRTHRNRRPY